MEVLKSNHPEASPATESNFRCYMGAPPVMVPLDITTDTVADVGSWILGGSGPWGADVVSLHQWLIRYGEASA